MSVYGYATRKSEVSFCATIRHADGASQWAHVRTNLGRSVAYAMIAKHFDGCKVEDFRDENRMTAYDREQAADDNGILPRNSNFGYSSFYEQQAGA